MKKDMYTEVNIFGEQYKLVSKHHESPHIHQIVDLLNHKMDSLAKRLPQYSKTKIAILTCLNITDELFSLMKQTTQDQQVIEEIVHLIDRTLDEPKTTINPDDALN